MPMEQQLTIFTQMDASWDMYCMYLCNMQLHWSHEILCMGAYPGVGIWPGHYDSLDSLYFQFV